MPGRLKMEKSRAAALLAAIKKVTNSRRFDKIAGAIIWGIIWLLLGMLTAQGMAGVLWR